MRLHLQAKTICLFLFVAAHFVAPRPAAAQDRPGCPSGSNPPQAVRLDGVTLEICTQFIENPVFFQPDPAQANQLAYATDPRDRSRQITILAVPAGAKSGVEDLPRVDGIRRGADFLASLREIRQKQGGDPRPGPRAVLFGQAVEGLVSDIPSPGVGAARPPLRVTEWAVMAGERLWVLRESQGAGAPPLGRASSDGLTGPPLAVWQASADPGAAASPSAAGPGPAWPASASQTALPVPAWWQGMCDYTHYTYAANNPNHIASYPLGANYRGLIACGPRPWFDSAPDVLVRFFPGAWGELEWECVELSMRFMYLAYGIPPYQADGNKVVANYTGTQLVKIANNTFGVAPQPGDVLSYCATCTVGHTSVVMSSTVDAGGDGYVTVIEQNNSSNGQSTLSVKDWLVVGNSGEVIGWLHLPQTAVDPPPVKTYLPLISQGNAP